MSDQAIQNAIRARDECLDGIAKAERVIAVLRAKLERAERFIKDWEEFATLESPSHVSVEASDTLDTAPPPPPRRKNPRKEDVGGGARQILLERGNPLGKDDLLAALAERGLALHGKEPSMVLQTMLWRMRDKIIHMKGIGYWPIDVAHEASGHEPGDAFMAHTDPEEITDVMSQLRQPTRQRNLPRHRTGSHTYIGPIDKGVAPPLAFLYARCSRQEARRADRTKG
jgi:hypothetical protein